MNKPPHPGKHVRINCLDASNLSVTAAAKALGVTRQTLNNLVNEKSSISPEMAVRFEKIGWSTCDHWMRLQMNFDLASVRARQDEIIVPAATQTMQQNAN